MAASQVTSIAPEKQTIQNNTCYWKPLHICFLYYSRTRNIGGICKYLEQPSSPHPVFPIGVEVSLILCLCLIDERRYFLCHSSLTGESRTNGEVVEVNATLLLHRHRLRNWVHHFLAVDKCSF